jgi:hypothetical protein
MRHPAALLLALAALASLAPAQTRRFQVLNEQVPAQTSALYALADFDLDGDQDLMTPSAI